MPRQKLESGFIRKIESELLSALFDYAIPLLDKKISAKKHAPKEDFFALQKNLEDIVSSKPKISLDDFKELGSLLSKNSNSKNLSLSVKDFCSSISLTRQKKHNEKSGGYSVFIKYEESQSEERLSFSIKKSDKDYSAEIISKKGVKDGIVPYSFAVSYEDSYAKERLAIAYRQQLDGYVKKHIESKEDMSNMVPLKWLNILPESVMGGVLGFTYLGENFMGRRADLVGKTARMVDIHESIHTPDEYETRVLTDWIMSRERSKYIK